MRRTPLPPPRRRFGQNFLADRGAVARIVAALDPARAEAVVEIGPGRGALTAALLERIDRLVAVEIDRDLARDLAARYPGDRLTVVEGDVLEVPLASLAPRAAIVGNLPYNISKPFAMKMVREREAVSRALLMFQREVADRLTARPGTSAYGPLTVLAGESFRIERVFHLPPGAFHPRPKVESTVTRWIPREGASRPEPDPLAAVLRASFAHRRQTLLKNLRGALAGGEDEARALLERAGLDPRLRAEAIPPEGFVALARVWP